MDYSVFQSILLDTDGTVTDLIRHMTGEEIHVTKLSQEVINDKGPAVLELKEPGRLLQRRILLTGSRHYLYAESYFVVDRMSDYLRKQLLESEIPIGLLWQQERLETFREIIERGSEPCGDLKQYFPDIDHDQLLTRSYLVFHQRVPLGVITEKFPIDYFR